MSRVKSAFKAMVVLMTIWAVVILPLGPGCGPAKESRVVRIGYLRNDLHQLAFYAAREKGFFTDEGLDVREGGVFNAGPEEMSAFGAGQLDMGLAGIAPILTFASQDMADISVVAQANEVGSAVVVRAGLECEDLADLKGRTVAVPGYSTVQDFLLRLAMKRYRLNDGDLRITTLKPPEMVPALAASHIDAFIAWEPYPSVAVSQKAGRIILKSSVIWPDHPCCMLVADRGFVQRNPETVRKVVRAHIRATEYINRNPLEAVDMGAMFTGQEREVVREALKNIKFRHIPELKEMKKYARFLSEQGILKDKDPEGLIEHLVDARYITGGGD